MQQAFIPSSAFIFGVLVMAMGHRTLGRMGIMSRAICQECWRCTLLGNQALPCT